MAESAEVIDWEALGRTTNLEEVVPYIPPKRVIELVGVKRAVELIGLPNVLNAIDKDEALERLLTEMPPERVQVIQEKVNRKRGQVGNGPEHPRE